MEIIENNYKPNDTKHEVKSNKVVCENCGSKLIIDDNDLIIGEYGAKCWVCAACGESNYVDEGITLTEKNVIFPQHFSNTLNAVEIKDEEITKWVREAVAVMDKNIDYSYHASGDTAVIAFKSDEDYNDVTVIVARKYHETFVKIPEERY